MEELVIAFPSVSDADHVVEDADPELATAFAAMMLRMGYGLETDGWIVLRWPNKDPEFDDLCALRRWKLREASDGLFDYEFDPAEDVEWLVEDLRVSMATW